MTKDEAIKYCYRHKNKYLSDAYACGDDGQRQFECLVGSLEGGAIQPHELADYGMDYDEEAIDENSTK